MPKPKILSAFNPEERDLVQKYLGIKVAHMMGRKFEEGDWSYVYCKAKSIVEKGWSNLDIDIVHDNIGVEQKMLCYRSGIDLSSAFGTTLMHPSLTRSIRIPETTDPDEAMKIILDQYSDIIRRRREKIRFQNNTGKEVELRTGWLLWQESLKQFLYFEEEMTELDSNEYYAEWKENIAGESRKGSKNLWIYEKTTGKKRYSITTSAGAKIQPYFDVPPPNNPNVYLFTVIGELVRLGYVRIWLTTATYNELTRLLETTDIDLISEKLNKICSKIELKEELEPYTLREEGVSLELSEETYKLLLESINGVSDEHRVRLVLSQMR